MAKKASRIVTCVLSVVTATGLAWPRSAASQQTGRLQPTQPAEGPAVSGEEVRGNILRLLDAVARTHPGSAELQNRVARVEAKFKGFSGEQMNEVARSVDAAALASAVGNLEARQAEVAAGGQRQRAGTQSMTGKALLVGPASHPLLNQDPSSGEIYDTVCGNTFSDPQSDKDMVISIDSLTIAAIVGDVACNAIVVVLGEGTNLPACIIAGALHEAVEAVQFALDLNNFCDGDVSGNENHATFENLYHVHNDLINSVANDDANTTNIISDIDSKTASIISNSNAGTASIIANDNTDESNIISNSNSNTTQIINDSNSNRDTIINEIRVVGCELDRLLNTPEGQRSSSILSCSAQPGFPYKFTGNGTKAAGAQSTDTNGTPTPSKGVWDGRGQDGVPILAMMGTVTMETTLLAGRLVPSYYLPESHGGMIEVVKSLVWNTIDGQEELNIAPTETADARLAAQEADALLDQQRFVEAYRRYAVAYQRLVPQEAPDPNVAVKSKTR